MCIYTLFPTVYPFLSLGLILFMYMFIIYIYVFIYICLYFISIKNITYILYINSPFLIIPQDPPFWWSLHNNSNLYRSLYFLTYLYIFSSYPNYFCVSLLSIILSTNTADENISQIQFLLFWFQKNHVFSLLHLSPLAMIPKYVLFALPILHSCTFNRLLNIFDSPISNFLTSKSKFFISPLSHTSTLLL